MSLTHSYVTGVRLTYSCAMGVNLPIVLSEQNGMHVTCLLHASVSDAETIHVTCIEQAYRLENFMLKTILVRKT